MSPTRREILRTAGGVAALATTGAVTGCSTYQAADVPVGGGTVIDGTNFVVTQPTKGTYKGFVRVCPHAGCQVDEVRDGSLLCPCHGSEFDITDGHVTKGPATAGLGKAKVTEKGGTLSVSGS